MNRQRSPFIALLLCGALLPACGKNAFQDITAPPHSSNVKFFNFAVGAPGANFYANDTKLSAISSGTGTESPLGTAYGAAAAGAYYTAIVPGQYTLSGRIADTTAAVHNLPISSVSTMIADGKFYSYYQSGFYNTATKTSDAFVVEDAYPATFDYSVATVRFVNAISNAAPMTLYATSTDSGSIGKVTTVGAAVPYKSAGAFTNLPPGAYDLSTRYTGASTNAITRTGVSFAAGGTYSISARGDITVTSTTATNRPYLDNTANR